MPESQSDSDRSGDSDLARALSVHGCECDEFTAPLLSTASSPDGIRDWVPEVFSADEGDQLSVLWSKMVGIPVERRSAGARIESFWTEGLALGRLGAVCGFSGQRSGLNGQYLFARDEARFEEIPGQIAAFVSQPAQFRMIRD